MRKQNGIGVFRKKLYDASHDAPKQQQSLLKQSSRVQANNDEQNQRQSKAKSNYKFDTLKNRKSLWTTTAQALTRFRSPSHRVPQAKRFTSIQQQKQKNFTYNTLQLHIPCTKNSKDIKFCNAQRKGNFLYKDEQNSPAPATYNKVRYLDNSFYKRNIELQKIRAQILTQSRCRNAQDYRNFLQQTFASQQAKNASVSSGRTFYKFNKHNKLYLPHAKNIIYQPDFVDANPGQGSYSVELNRKKGPSFSFRKILKRWIDPSNVQTPGNGPATYQPFPQYQQSIHWTTSTKGTFQKSHRTYLAHPETQSPGPVYKIKRYLQDNDLE